MSSPSALNFREFRRRGLGLDDWGEKVTPQGYDGLEVDAVRPARDVSAGICFHRKKRKAEEASNW
jgi:hypothetical protein